MTDEMGKKLGRGEWAEHEDEVHWSQAFAGLGSYPLTAQGDVDLSNDDAALEEADRYEREWHAPKTVTGIDVPMTTAEEEGERFAVERAVVGFDLDSTLSESGWRVPLINNWDAESVVIEDRLGWGMREDGLWEWNFRGQSRDARYDVFYRLGVHDKPYEIAVGLVHQLREVFDVVYVTGRPEKWRADTLGWIQEHGLSPLGHERDSVEASRRWLLMRPDGSRVRAAQMKMQLLDGCDWGLPVMFFDDDITVVQALNLEGIAASLVVWHGGEIRGTVRG